MLEALELRDRFVEAPSLLRHAVKGDGGAGARDAGLAVDQNRLRLGIGKDSHDGSVILGTALAAGVHVERSKLDSLALAHRSLAVGDIGCQADHGLQRKFFNRRLELVLRQQSAAIDLGWHDRGKALPPEVPVRTNTGANNGSAEADE